MSVTAVPTWFGPEGESLFGCVHLPADGRVRGGVVICPPLAQELTRTQAAVRALAVSLAERGLLALRFDYWGTGDSALASSRPGAVDSWLRSIVEAHDFLVRYGVDRIGLVGLRTGALLASAALPQLAPVQALGLWDPISSGRRFMRQEHALYSVSVRPSAPAHDGVLEGVGISFDTTLQRDLRALTLTVPDPGQAQHTAVFHTAANPPGPAEYADPAVEVVGIPDRFEDGPSDISFFAGRLPTTAIRLITEWADRCMPASVGEVPVAIGSRDVATMSTEHGPVRETLVAIPRAPAPGHLHAIVSEPVDGREAARSRPAAILLNISVTGRTGPTRGWVTSARRVAAGGTTAVRFDRYGLGESIDDTAGYVAKDFDADAVYDVGVVARFVRPDDPGDVVLAGLCSGAWAAATAARELRPRKLVLMNMNLLTWTPAPLGDAQARSTGVEWVLDPDPSRTSTRVSRLVQALRHRWRRFPWLAARLGLIHRPGPVLKALPLDTTRVTLLQCPADLEEFVDLGGPDAIRRRARHTAIELVPVPDADHGLVGRSGRDRMLDELVGQLGTA